jgi:heat shock protein HslJ
MTVRFAFSGLVVLALAGCSLVPGASPSLQVSPLRNSSWVLSSIGDQPIQSGVNATLQFALVQASGIGGCNQFSTTYTTDGTASLSFGPIAATRMFCEGAGSTVETAYFAALARVTRYLLQDDTLTLTGEGEVAELTFARAAPATVEGPWNVIGVNNGSGGVESVAGVSAAFSFLPDGTIEGHGGCNNFSGGYSVDGESIAIGPLMATQMACPDPAGSFESWLLVALDNAATWSVSGDMLTLRDADGATQVTAQSAIGR